MSGCEALALSGRAACTKPLLAAAAYAAAADAAYDATADAAARKQSQQATAEICRKYIPLELILAAIKSQEKQKACLYRDWETDRKSTRLNSSHRSLSRMPSSA